MITKAVEAEVSAKYAKKVLKRLHRHLEGPTPADLETNAAASAQAEAPLVCDEHVASHVNCAGSQPLAPKARAQHARRQQQGHEQPVPPQQRAQRPPSPIIAPTSPRPKPAHQKPHGTVAQSATVQHTHASKAHEQGAAGRPTRGGVADQRAAATGTAPGLQGHIAKAATHVYVPRQSGAAAPTGKKAGTERRPSLDRQAQPPQPLPLPAGQPTLQQLQRLQHLQPPPPPPPAQPRSVSQLWQQQQQPAQQHGIASNGPPTGISLYSQPPSVKPLPGQPHPVHLPHGGLHQVQQHQQQQPALRQMTPPPGTWGLGGTPAAAPVSGWQESSLFGRPLVPQAQGMLQDPSLGGRSAPPNSMANLQQPALQQQQQPPLPVPLRQAEFPPPVPLRLDRGNSGGRQSLDTSQRASSLASSLAGGDHGAGSRSETPHAGLLGAGSSLFAHPVVPSSPLATNNAAGTASSTPRSARAPLQSSALAFGPALLDSAFGGAAGYGAFSSGLPPPDAVSVGIASQQQPPQQQQMPRRDKLTHHAPLQLSQSHFGPTVSANGGQGMLA